MKLTERFEQETGQKPIYRKDGFNEHTLQYVWWLEAENEKLQKEIQHLRSVRDGLLSGKDIGQKLVHSLREAEMLKALKSVKDLFEEISCLCAEGPELMRNIDIIEAILKKAHSGYNEAKAALGWE